MASNVRFSPKIIKMYHLGWARYSKLSVWGQIGRAKINVLIHNNNITNLMKEHLSTSQSAFNAFGTILDFKAIVQNVSSGVDKGCGHLISYLL